MIKYHREDSIEIENSTGLPTLVITPEGRAMGAVPGWSVLLDPSYVTETGVRNRALPNTVPQWSTTIPAITAFENGEPAIQPTNELTGRLLPPFGDINPNRWSVFFVISDLVEGNSASPRQEIITPLEEAEDVVCPRIVLTYLSGTTLSVYENSNRGTDQPRRIFYNEAGADASTPSLFACTFSIERGLSIWKNGEMKVQNTDDKRPLNFGYKSSEFECFRLLRAKLGMTGVINIDLSAPENAGHRRAIERFLMSKYGIPEGPQ